jgi:hypothetical protein
MANGQWILRILLIDVRALTNNQQPTTNFSYLDSSNPAT